MPGVILDISVGIWCSPMKIGTSKTLSTRSASVREQHRKARELIVMLRSKRESHRGEKLGTSSGRPSSQSCQCGGQIATREISCVIRGAVTSSHRNEHIRAFK